MILTCEDCNISYRTSDEPQLVIIKERYIVQKPEAVKEQDLGFDAEWTIQQKQDCMAAIDQQHSDDQKEYLISVANRKFGDKVNVLDENGMRFLVIYQDLEEATVKESDGWTEITCTGCSKVLSRNKSGGAGGSG